jgi:hypothetical protein
VNAIRRLSGLHAGEPSPALPPVSRRAFALPSTGTIHRSCASFFSSYAGSATEKTAHRPSGETDGAPTRFMSQSASWVSGCVPGAAGAACAAGSGAGAGRRGEAKAGTTTSRKARGRSADLMGGDSIRPVRDRRRFG